jgi:hypothetical protein
MKRFLSGAALALAALSLLVALAWAGMVLFFSPLLPLEFRTGATVAWAIGSAVVAIAFARRRARKAAATAVLGAVALVAAGWASLQPSNERQWQADVARLATARMDGERVTISNVRNAIYRSESDLDVRYEERVYDLATLESIDLIASYWMGPQIAHTLVSFGFAGGERLAISIEARKESTESYSTIGGFFRNYELVYVVADERDVVRLRTTIRRDPPEDVYIYRVMAPPEVIRDLFLTYVVALNTLAERPAWYNSATTNCTATIWRHAVVVPDRIPFSWKILISGFLPSYMHAQGQLVPGHDFQDLRARGHVNAAARAADGDPDFARRIRSGVPGYATRD